MAEEGGEEQQGEDDLEDDEHVLPDRVRRGRRAHGGQRDQTPVQRVQVLQRHRVLLLLGELPSGVPRALQADGHDVVEAGVPVEQRDEVVHEGGGADDVGVVGVPLRAVQEGPEAVDLHQAETAEDGAEADGQVEDVERQQAQAVDVEGGGVGVVDS